MEFGALLIGLLVGVVMAFLILRSSKVRKRNGAERRKAKRGDARHAVQAMDDSITHLGRS